MVDKSRMAMSTSTNPRWPAQAPLQALKVLYLSLCVYFGVDLGILYSNKEKSIETLTDVLGILIL